MEKHIAYISFGSNMGDKKLNCEKGIRALTDGADCILMGISKYYQTAPVDYLDQDWFVNGVAKVKTSLSPLELLHRLKTIEKNAGRKTGTVRFGPRILDLDILMYDDLVMDDPLLVIPHPRMHKRRFVLTPFCDIDPRSVHPVLKKEIQYLCRHLDDDRQEVVEYTCDS